VPVAPLGYPWGTMQQEASSPSLIKRALAVVVLIMVGLLVLKLVAGFVVGVVVTLFYVLVAVFVVAAFVWALRHL
jgi:hypothetical protein